MSEDQYGVWRSDMVDEQLAPRGIRDPRALEAFRRVPRHLFVPEGQRHNAYADSPLPIGQGQTISQPYMVALMTQTLDVQPQRRVLEIGTGSGYQAAILCELGAQVYTVERHAELSERAADTLGMLGYTHFHAHVADGTLGWPEEAPFDRIIVTAAAPHVPESLKSQLAPDGKLLLPVGGITVQTLTLVTRRGDAFEERAICECVFVKLIGQEGYPAG